MTQTLLYALIPLGFVAVAYVGYAIVDATYLQRARVRRRMETFAGTTGAGEAQAPQTPKAKEEPLPTIAKIISSQGLADKLLLQLMRAGIKLRPSEFVGIASGIALGLGLAAAVFTRNPLAEVIAILVGFAGPFVYLRSVEARRLTMFNRQLPDALSLIGSSIRSGYSFQRAMSMVSEEMPDPISEEFRRVLNEINVGLQTDAALVRMVARVRSYDLELVVTAVVIQQQIGGNLAEIIDNIAATIRERVRIEGELAALTAEGRISGVVLVALPIVMAAAIMIINPGYLKPLITEPQGTYMIVGAICLQAIGAVVIKRMLALDY